MPEFKPIFSKDGILSKEYAKFEYREEQDKMASLVQQAIDEEKHCVVEAGTGVGKSLAYLFPVAIACINNDFRAIVSTETKNLQHQLLDKDLPLVIETLKKYLNVEIKAAIAKGRGNFICRRRMNKYDGRLEEGSIDGSYARDFYKLKEWINVTDDGDFDDLEWEVPGALKNRVNSTSTDCLNNNCPFLKESKCFRMLQKKKLKGCNIIIANHALYMIDVFTEATILPRHDIVVLDEAQHVYSRAVETLSTEITNFKIRDLINDIKTMECIKKSHDLFSVEGIIDDVFLNGIVDISDRFFNDFLEYVEDHRNKKEKYSKEFEFPPDHDLDNAFIFIEKLKELNTKLERILYEITGDEAVEMSGYMERCNDFVDDLIRVTNADAPERIISDEEDGIIVELKKKEYINWVECRKREERKMPFIAIHSAPYTVSEELRKDLFEKKRTVILTSATMAVGKDFNFFKNQLGIDNPVEMVIGSPFDYKKNCCLFISDEDPNDKDVFSSNMVETLKQALEISKGRAFCLFTSYSMMNKMHEQLKDIKYEVLKQGEMPRKQLIKRFLESENAVLFGTDSFWEGVSIEGAKLSAVIIDKIPFPVPTDPVMKAQIAKAKKDFGEKWFTKYYLPIAILKLKQGFGRLIRTKEDKGFVVLMDGRIKHKGYGKKILESLPPAKIVKSLKEIDTVMPDLSTKL